MKEQLNRSATLLKSWPVPSVVSGVASDQGAIRDAQALFPPGCHF